MAADELVHHVDESDLQPVLTDVEHSTLTFVRNMGVAAVSEILTINRLMGPSLEGATAFAADELTGERIASLILVGASHVSVHGTVMHYQLLSGIKKLMTDDCLVMVSHIVLCHFAVIVVSVELAVGIGLLVKNVAGVFLISDDAVDPRRDPFAAVLGWNSTGVQVICDGIRAFTAHATIKISLHNRCNDDMMFVPESRRRYHNERKPNS